MISLHLGCGTDCGLLNVVTKVCPFMNFKHIYVDKAVLDSQEKYHTQQPNSQY